MERDTEQVMTSLSLRIVLCADVDRICPKPAYDTLKLLFIK